MSKHLMRDLSQIERSILEIGALVEQSIVKAISVLTSGHAELKQEVLVDDERIDRLEVELEENCLKALALHQPVAADLRFIIAVIKVNSTLERMGDHACNIARGALDLAEYGNLSEQVDTRKMAELARQMVRNSLNSLVHMDVSLARHVLETDDLVDDQKSKITLELIEFIERGVSEPKEAIHLLLATRNLERIADLATNIAEDVIFLVEGEIIRHKTSHEITSNNNGPR